MEDPIVAICLRLSEEPSARQSRADIVLENRVKLRTESALAPMVWSSTESVAPQRERPKIDTDEPIRIEMPRSEKLELS